jgi:hypothetical protein
MPAHSEFVTGVLESKRKAIETVELEARVVSWRWSDKRGLS